jgi:hypothetical protein
MSFTNAAAQSSSSDPRTSPRPAALIPLYVGFGSVQALDVHSTLLAIDRGARETNPLVRFTTGSPAGLIALKTGSTAGVIYLTEKLRKRHPVAAVLVMIGLNSGYAMVAAHNYRIARR